MTTAVATGLEKVSFHSNLKERQCQRMLKLPHNCAYLTTQCTSFAAAFKLCRHSHIRTQGSASVLKTSVFPTQSALIGQMLKHSKRHTKTKFKTLNDFFIQIQEK